MKKFLIAAACGLLLTAFMQAPTEKNTPPKSFYDLSIQSLDGKSTIRFSDFKGKKVLLVNTASQCGYTGQYKDLQALYTRYSNNLVVVAFPCNQFGGQEPWANDKIKNFCSLRYDVTFPMTDKVNVKAGEDQHIIYQWLTQKKFNGKEDINIRWNFGKFLIDEKGRFVKYFPSQVEPMDKQILSLIEGK